MVARCLLVLLVGALLCPVFAFAQQAPVLPNVPIPLGPSSPIPPSLPLQDCPTTACMLLHPDNAPCCPSSPCFPRCRLEADAEYLFWWLRGAPAPPLVTTAASTDLPILGMPSTSTLIGGNFLFDALSGGRFDVRCLLRDGLGLGVGGFLLENATQEFSALGQPVLGIATLAPDSGEDAAIILAGPLAATGAARVRLSTRMWGLDVNALYRVGDSEEFTLDLLAGFRFIQLAERLSLDTTTTIETPGLFVGVPTPPGSTYTGYDDFSCRNDFYGGQVGARAAMVWDRLVVTASARVALGSTRQQVGITGATKFQAPGVAPLEAPGHVFTQTTNIGTFVRDVFTVVPQASLALGYPLTTFARVTIGYDFLYWNNVARPGEQIDRKVNPLLVPTQDDGSRFGEARPAARVNGSDFWAQGLSFTLLMAF